MNLTRVISGVYGGSLPRIFQTYAVSVGTVAVQAVPVFPTQNPTAAYQPYRSSLTFHNPGTVDVYICQTVNAQGTAITPAVNGAGTLAVLAGSTWVIDAPGQSAWNAISVSSAALTVLEYVS